MLSIHAGWPCCCLAATRPAMTDGTSESVPEADRLYDDHLKELKQEG
jgi:hypothetical protein